MSRQHRAKKIKSIRFQIPTKALNRIEAIFIRFHYDFPLIEFNKHLRRLSLSPWKRLKEKSVANKLFKDQRFSQAVLFDFRRNVIARLLSRSSRFHQQVFPPPPKASQKQNRKHFNQFSFVQGECFSAFRFFSPSFRYFFLFSNFISLRSKLFECEGKMYSYSRQQTCKKSFRLCMELLIYSSSLSRLNHFVAITKLLNESLLTCKQSINRRKETLLSWKVVVTVRFSLSELNLLPIVSISQTFSN